MNPTLLGNLIVRLISGFIKVAEIVQITAAILWWHGLEPQKRWNPCVALAVVVFVARNLSAGTGATTPLCRWRQPGGFRKIPFGKLPEVKCSCKVAGKRTSAVPDYSDFQPSRRRSNPKQITLSPTKFPATQQPGTCPGRVPQTCHRTYILPGMRSGMSRCSLMQGSLTETRLRRSVRFRTPPDNRDSGFIG